MQLSIPTYITNAPNANDIRVEHTTVHLQVGDQHTIESTYSRTTVELAITSLTDCTFVYMDTATKQSKKLDIFSGKNNRLVITLVKSRTIVCFSTADVWIRMCTWGEK